MGFFKKFSKRINFLIIILFIFFGIFFYICFYNINKKYFIKIDENNKLQEIIKYNLKGFKLNFFIFYIIINKFKKFYLFIKIIFFFLLKKYKKKK